MFSLIHGNALFGLLAALFWGGGDFSGGMGAKHAGGTLRGALRIILLSHSASFCLLITIGLYRGEIFPLGRLLVWGIFAGVIGGLSVALFYIALARGAMGSSAAISGLLAAAVPAIFAILSEGSPGRLRLIGFLIACIAIWIVAASPTGVLETPAAKPAASTTFLAIGSGVGFGLYFIAIKMAGAGGVIWPMATARVGSIAACTFVVMCLSLSKRYPATPLKLRKPAILWALATALLDTCGGLLFLSATRAGRLDVAAVLASLYPATTILLAGMVLKERFSKRQAFGMAVAVVAVVLITL